MLLTRVSLTHGVPVRGERWHAETRLIQGKSMFEKAAEIEQRKAILEKEVKELYRVPDYEDVACRIARADLFSSMDLSSMSMK